MIFTDVDLAAIARGFGADGVSCGRSGDLSAIEHWLSSDRPAAVAGWRQISSDGGSWWLAEAFRGH